MKELPETRMAATSLTSVFNETCWTGQPMTSSERVKCNRCNDTTKLIHLRTDAWYDPYLPFGTNSGSYVHFGFICHFHLRFTLPLSGRFLN